MFAILTLIAVVVIIFGAIKSGCEKPYDKGCINNGEKFWKDTCNPDISPKELDRNIKAGKYR